MAKMLQKPYTKTDDHSLIISSLVNISATDLVEFFHKVWLATFIIKC